MSIYLQIKKKQKMFMVFSIAFIKGKNKSKTHVKNSIGFSITTLFSIGICRWKMKIDLFPAINQKFICKKLNRFQHRYFVDIIGTY